MQEVALYGPNGKPDWFWDLNPDGTVPVLVCHGGAVVYPDSDLALDTSEDGSAILGMRLNDRVDLQDKKLKQRIQKWRASVNAMLPVGKEAVLGGAKKKLFAMLQEMDGKVIGPYLCGDQVTSADCAAFPFLWRINDEFGLNDYSNLAAWLRHCNNNLAFSKTVQSAWWWWW
jgi:glutathione S-transferase